MRRRLLPLAVALAVSLFVPPAGADHDELPKEQDNGAQGRNTFNDPGHQPPIKACKDKLKATKGSLVIRRLPRGPLAPDVDGLDLVVNWGATCSSDASIDLCASWGFEQAFRFDNQYLRDRLEAIGHTGGLTYSEDEGGHAWRWWPKWLLEKHLPVFYEHLAKPMRSSLPVVASRPRFPFRFRSIAPSFSVYGYDVAVARETSEFLDMTNVSPKGFTLTGSGRATVTTAPLYRPGRSYKIGGGATKVARADSRGRLRIGVDLGPSHTSEQYSPQGRAMQQTPGYMTTRSVT